MLEWLYAMPFKHFEDFCAVNARAVAQEVADVGYGCFQGVKACGRCGEGIYACVVVAVVGEIEHFGTFS
jgi:hypothetical protein